MSDTSSVAPAPGNGPGRAKTAGGQEAPSVSGAQTLLRGLDVLEAVASGCTELATLSLRLGIARTTTHRLAAALVERRYLNFVPREGYSLGPKLLELGVRAQRDMPLRQIARAHLERLAEHTQDTVQLGILDCDEVLYLDKVPGNRRFDIRSGVGDRYPIWSTGLGKALVLDMGEAGWNRCFDIGVAGASPPDEAVRQKWLERMRRYAKTGVAFDLGEVETQLHCVAAPIRDASGVIIAALSVSSFAPYMEPARMEELSGTVRQTAQAISRELGWHGN